MKMLRMILCSAVVASFVACSADDISNADAGNYPDDFSDKEYAEVNWDLVTIQMKNAIAAKNGKSSAKALDAKEIEVFFDKEESIKEIFTKYVGFADSIYPGFEKLKTGKMYMDFRETLYAFHITGNTATKDLAFLKEFKVNYDVIREQYWMVGRIEGRPYRFCKSGETKQLKVKDQSQAEAVRTKWDYSAHLYCKNKADGLDYMVR